MGLDAEEEELLVFPSVRREKTFKFSLSHLCWIVVSADFSFSTSSRDNGSLVCAPWSFLYLHDLVLSMSCTPVGNMVLFVREGFAALKYS